MASLLIRLRYLLPVKSLVLLFIFIALIFLIICWNLLYSVIYIQGDLNNIGHLKRLENNARVAEARNYLTSKHRNETSNYHYYFRSKIQSRVKYPSVTFMFIAHDRNRRQIDYYQPNYLTQTVTTLWQAIERDAKHFGGRFSDISLSICDTESTEEIFFELNFLARLFDFFKILQMPSFKTVHCKEKFNFLSCLDLLPNKYQMEYVVVLEDDLLARDNVIPGLAEVFDDLSYQFGDKIQYSLAMVQLFNPSHEIRYSIHDIHSLKEILILALPTAFFLLIFIFRIRLWRTDIVRNSILFIISLIISMILIVTVGRPYWLSLYYRIFNRHYITESFSHSSAAILLSRQFLVKILKQTIDNSCIDDISTFELLQTLAKDDNRKVLSTNINLFNHIGLYSSYKNSVLNSDVVE